MKLLWFFENLIDIDDDIPEDSHNTPHESPISENKVSSKSKGVWTWSSDKKQVVEVIDSPAENLLLAPLILSFIETAILSKIDQN